MKKISIYIIILCSLTIFSGCLKDDIKPDYSGIEPIIINPLSNYPGRSFFPIMLTDSALGTKKLNLRVNYSFIETAPKNITVTLKVNDSLSIAYNNAFGKNYIKLPASAYSVGDLRVTIAKGADQAQLQIIVDPTKIAGSNDYIIAFTIVNADGIKVASNYRDMVYTLKGR
ncbi:DUF1735 domain-containing protein [Mucilaginibacter celer]|nr:DUF1735 domain-containing protein [Mucilaginibacter celer]